MHAESKGDPSQHKRQTSVAGAAHPPIADPLALSATRMGLASVVDLQERARVLKKHCGLKQHGRHQAYASSGYCRLASPVAGANAATAAAAAAATHHPPAAPVAEPTATHHDSPSMLHSTKNTL